jgi:hypothetical protein
MQLQQQVAYAQAAVHGKYMGITKMPTAIAGEKGEAKRKWEIHNRQKEPLLSSLMNLIRLTTMNPKLDAESCSNRTDTLSRGLLLAARLASIDF